MPSPIFTINGSPITQSVAVAPGALVTCQLADISGVSPVEWRIEGTDETKTASSYTFTQSGSVGQTYSGNALEPGTAVTISCTVAGGVDPATQSPSSTMTASGKFYVPTRAGLEVLSLDEQEDDNRVSSSTHGCVKPLNEAIRKAGIEPFDGTCTGGGSLAILDYPVPLDSKLMIKAKALAHDTINDEGAGYEVHGTWKNVGGVVTLIGGGYLFSSEDDAGWSLVATFVGTDARFLFTGDGVNDTHIEAEFEMMLMRL